MTPFSPSGLAEPIVLAPMAGGPSTVELAVAVCEAGGLGFLPLARITAVAAADDIAALRARTRRPFGVNLFVPGPPTADPAAVERYARALEGEAGPLGEARHDDDEWEAKLDLVEAQRVPVVSFTFGCPPPEALERLTRAGCAAWVSVTTVEEARAARDAGADALIVQGVEAGGHRATWNDDAPGDVGLLALLQLVREDAGLPLVAAGGIVTGAGVAAVLAAGAAAAQLGTAFMRTPEAGTSPAHRDALATQTPTALTRAFSGRTARGLVNRFLREHEGQAPSAYPEVQHITAPLRAAAQERGDPDAVNLWAGQAHGLAATEPAGELVRRLGAEARAALADATRRLDDH